MELMYYVVRAILWPDDDISSRTSQQEERVYLIRKHEDSGENENTVFVACNKDDEEVICSHLNLNPSKYKIKYLHKDCPAGHNQYEYIDRYVRNKSVPVLMVDHLVVTTDFTESMCKYMLTAIAEESQVDGKVIPVLFQAEKTQLPACLQSLSHVKLTDAGRLIKLEQSLDEYFNSKIQVTGNLNRITRQISHRDYFLYEKVVPKCLLKTCNYQREFQGKLHCDRWDHKVVLEARFNGDAELAKTMSVHPEVKHVVSKCNGNWKEEENSLHCVNIINNKDNGEYSNEFTFWIRFYHPRQIECLEVKINFALRVPDDKSKDNKLITVEEKVIKFLTKSSNRTTVHNKHKQRVQQMQYEADTELDSEERQQKFIAVDRNKQGTSQEKQNTRCPVKPSHCNEISTTTSSSSCKVLSIFTSGKSRYILHKEPPQRICSIGFLCRKEVRQMLRGLEYLADNGDAEFVNVSNDYLDKFKQQAKWDEYVLVAIKMCALAHYKDELTECKTYMKMADERIDSCSYPLILKARLLYYKSAIYRELKKFGKAETAINRCLAILQYVECGEDTAKGYYNQGKLYMVMMETCPRQSSAYKPMAVKAFEQAMEHFLKDNIVDHKQIRRCLLNICRLLVNCPMSKARSGQLCLTFSQLKEDNMNKRVTSDDITQAKKCYDQLRQRHGLNDQTSKRNLMQIVASEAEMLFAEAEICMYKDDKKGAGLQLTVCYSKLEEAYLIAMDSEFKELKKIKSFMEIIDLLRNNQLDIDKQEMQQITDADVGGSASVDSNNNLSAVYTSGMEEISGDDNNSGNNSDRK